MSENTKIEWCDHTFNPWVGCTKISLDCDHCYAEGWARRSGQVVWGSDRKRTSIANWRLPIKWDKHAALMQSAWAQGIALHGGDESACIAAGFIKPVRPKVFCASLADVFDNEVPVQWRADLLQLIDDTPNLDWLLLTKRIGNVNAMLDRAEMIVCNRDWTNYLPRPNIWLGATICNQAEADRDIPKLLAVPAHKRFLSMEPLLGPVDLISLKVGKQIDGSDTINCLEPDDWEIVVSRWRNTSNDWRESFKEYYGAEINELTGPIHDSIDWVIVGGESGPNARPMHPDWASSLRDQCEAAGVPFLFKQWGEWKSISQMEEADHIRLYKPNVKALPHEDQCNLDDIYGRTCTVPYTVLHLDGSTHGISEPNAFIVGAMQTFKIGKKAAGRLLDGREWNGVPA